ncbi:hypothetical protein [Mucilaginibacter sp. OK098]|uniref:hypothetical protein n=1 Tax=Mucilaginibacter sp. OK098 TaxID=1855297 RepID=UPI000914A8B8|nr:hypothetical protein [Mucilaginibacter sp. OK098]SHM56994.1 hypothetical protein SAMN05216524_102548 [Mucilaginibacter sp. OK098]
MSHRKPLERRTFSQDRYEILIKRQKSGKATFNELTELDEIVNRDPSIREKVLIENLFISDSNDQDEQYNKPGSDIIKPVQHQSLLSRLKAIIDRIFFTFLVKSGILVIVKSDVAVL